MVNEECANEIDDLENKVRLSREAIVAVDKNHNSTRVRFEKKN